jgi:serine/threonine-protein kinase ULK2
MFKYNKIDEFTNSTIPFVMIQTEYCPGGDLDIFINKKHYELEDDLVIHFVDLLIESIFVLHERGIIHRDIKTQNIFLFENEKNLKIGDFGFIKKIDEDSMTSFCGTKNYLPPEIKVGGRYKISADIWSLGIVLFQLITRLPEITLGDIKENIQKDSDFLKKSEVGSFLNYKMLEEFFPHEPELAEMCISCLKVNPSERPTIHYLKRMMWNLKKRNIIKLSTFFDMRFIKLDFIMLTNL